MIRKTLAATLGGVVLAGLGIAATATPASAAWSDCDPGALCAYLSDNGGGTPGQVFGDNANLLQYNKFDNAESLYNNGNSCHVRVFTATSFRGNDFVLPRGARIGDLDALHKGIFADNVASNRWVC